MQIHARPEIHAMELVTPVLVALLYICACSFFREPNRRNFNAIMIAGARLRQSHVYSTRGIAANKNSGATEASRRCRESA
jgi:hypothetical protein